MTKLGTTTLGLLDVRLTVAPPIGAAALSVTVPVEPFPPITDEGEEVRDVRLSPVTTRV